MTRVITAKQALEELRGLAVQQGLKVDPAQPALWGDLGLTDAEVSRVLRVLVDNPGLVATVVRQVETDLPELLVQLASAVRVGRQASEAGMGRKAHAAEPA